MKRPVCTGRSRLIGYQKDEVPHYTTVDLRRNIQQGCWRVLSTRLSAFPPVSAPCESSEPWGLSCRSMAASNGRRATGASPALPVVAEKRGCRCMRPAGLDGYAASVLGRTIKEAPYGSTVCGFT